MGSTWLSRVDPVAVVVALTSLVVYELHGHLGGLSRDLGIYAYAGQQLLEGEPPYQGILNRAGPLAHVIPGIGVGFARLVGVGDLVGVRIFFMFIAVAAVVVVYGLCRALFGSRSVAVGGAAAMLSYQGFIELAADGPREKTPMVLFLVLCLWALHRRRWCWSGVWLSLATLTLQIAFPLGAGAFAAAWIWVGRGRRLRILACFVVGGAVPLAVCIAYFAAVGGLGDAVEAFLVINAEYSVSNPPSDDPGATWAGMRSGYGWSLWVLVLGSVAVLAELVRAFRARSDAQAPLSVTLASYGAGLLVFLAWCLRDFDSWPDAFPALPVGAVGVAALAARLGERVSHRSLVAVVAGWAVVATALSATWSLTQGADRLVGQRALAAATLRELPDDATFFSMEVPKFLVLGGRSSVSRLQTFSGGLDDYVDETYPGGLEGLAERVADQRTTVVLVKKGRPTPTWLAPTLEEEYVKISRKYWRTYLHRSVDPETRREVDREIRRVVRRINSE